MPTIREIQQAVDSFAPPGGAAPWDNTGVLIDSGPAPPGGPVLLCIDLTDEVLDEAIRLGAHEIVAYHPVIFLPIKQISDARYVKCIRHGISVYCPHTQLDPLMNSFISGLVGDLPISLEDALRVLKGAAGLDRCRVVRGMRLGDNGSDVNAEGGHTANAVDGISGVKPVDGIKAANTPVDGIKTVSTPVDKENEDADGANIPSSHDARQGTYSDVVVGVGSAFKGVEYRDKLIVTGEMGHHDLLACKRNGCSVILLEHSNSERIFLPELKRLLEEALEGGVFLISNADCDPVEIA